MKLNKIYNTDCKIGLQTIPDNSIDCCVTSPPYYGLRDYGTATWMGGSPDCKHSERVEKNFELSKQSNNRGNSKVPKGTCPRCGAVRVDLQIGLEDTPEQYIKRLVEVFMEVHRVLKPTGTLWLNINDSYWRSKKYKDIKRKDMIGIPYMLAFALRGAGWYLRQDIIWHKPNPMPESVKDRCTNAHEHIFLLSKSKKYYYDYESIMEYAAYDGRKDTRMKGSHKYSEGVTELTQQTFAACGHERWRYKDGRYVCNKRSVWKVSTCRYKGSHFAVFPQELIVDCVKAGCPPNGIVLDPFMGAGTTAVVARKLNRNFVGMELNEKYIRIAEKRLHDELGVFYTECLSSI